MTVCFATPPTTFIKSNAGKTLQTVWDKPRIGENGLNREMNSQKMSPHFEEHVFAADKKENSTSSRRSISNLKDDDPLKNQPKEDDPSSPPFMVLLVGLPGSGKSMFAEAIEKRQPWKYGRVNQDILKSRKKCERACRRLLQKGMCPVIDRCNFDQKQRKHFLDIAKEAGDVPVDCVIFTYSKETCIERCERRVGHETIPPSEARKIVSMISSGYSPPLEEIQRKYCDGDKKEMESFRVLHNVISFDMSNDLIKRYLG
eukprot:CAMPEP_0195515364 /NCGR_PEP_ID=MMETSP0794_2-20130614/6453_1 /TAXON_ID=515487 /ORGANISM="Stephanopyxis turris, Strain CCMP 815" /LENGTH=257 /DNA_ID=CAMNT_0040643767 /DNA_START=81 /DNA_END=854 /DNA_ORIENTATION=-